MGTGPPAAAPPTPLPDNAALGLVVVDTDAMRADLARRDGAQLVIGDGGDVTTLRAAHVPEASHVVVAVPDDHTAVRITTTVRSLSQDAMIITLVRDQNWRTLAIYVGAVLRHGIRLWRDHPEVSQLHADDRLRVLRAAPHHKRMMITTEG